MIFLFLIFIYQPTTPLPSLVPVTPCCPPASYLDLTLPTHPTCHPSSPPSNTPASITIPGGQHGAEVTVTMLGRGQQSRLPDCTGGLEVHDLSPGFAVPDAWITTDGHLVTARYGEQFQHGHFCLETTTTGTIVAVMCNPCRGKVQCIHLCCPHGQAFLQNADYDYSDYNSPSSVCVKVDGLEYHPEVWHKEEDRILEWERYQHYILTSPSLGRKDSNSSVGFQCPEKYGGISWAPEDLGDFKIVSDGSLRGSNLPDYEASEDGSVKTTRVWSSDNYCMIIGAPPDYTDYSETNNDTAEDTPDELKQTFMHCLKHDEVSWQEQFTRIFHPVALSISIAFIFLTLLAYFIESGLRETIVGKITIGFLANLACCFIVITDTYVKDGDKSNDRRETLPCIISGYLILYFFHAFFFWLNTMVIHIWLPFSSWSATTFKRTQRLILCFVYAQGLPLIICIITAIIDAFGKGTPSSLLHHYPEMGVYSCFLGSQKTSSRKSYFVSPVFIYHQSVIILLQISNLVFLGLTGTHLCRPGNDKERKNKGRHLQNFHLFVKLFFILGFHWIAELVSTALGEEHGFNETFYVRLILDLVNLFAGVLIFLVLICNKQVLNSLKQRLCGQTSHDSRENIQVNNILH